jgi:ATP synthase protein I
MKLKLLLKIFLIQLSILCVIVMATWFTGKVLQALSLFLGGLIALIPNFTFSILFFQKRASKPRKILNAFYYGEGLKFLLTVVFFVLVFQWQALQPFSFFLGFMVLQVVCWITFVLQA